MAGDTLTVGMPSLSEDWQQSINMSAPAMNDPKMDVQNPVIPENGKRAGIQCDPTISDKVGDVGINIEAQKQQPTSLLGDIVQATDKLVGDCRQAMTTKNPDLLNGQTQKVVPDNTVAANQLAGVDGTNTQFTHQAMTQTFGMKIG